MTDTAATGTSPITGTATVTTYIFAGPHGTDAIPVQIHAEPSPHFEILGLDQMRMRLTLVRVRSACQAIGISEPHARIKVVIPPAIKPTSYSTLDLPIMVALLHSSGVEVGTLPTERLLIAGELGMDGSVRPIRGVLAATEMAQQMDLQRILVPEANAWEASLVDGMTVHGIRRLDEIRSPLKSWHGSIPTDEAPDISMTDLQGLPEVVTQVAGLVALRKGMLLDGAPGTGKTMIARRIPTILPDLTREESIAITRTYSCVGLARSLVTQRPFRAPHYTISPAALCGTGGRPGELQLAAHGVLFLDELSEFQRLTLEALALEIRAVPEADRPLIVVADNPCPCGFHGSDVRVCCCCSPEAVHLQQERVQRFCSTLGIDATVKVPSLLKWR